MSIAALLLADGRLPTGGHTQSGGLEPAMNAGLSAEQIPDFLITRLHSTATVDAGCAVVARHRLSRGEDLEPVVAAWAARTPSEVVRAAAIEVGRGYTRVAGRLGDEVNARAARLPRPIALASLAFRLNVSARDLAALVCHEEIQSVCAAALKLAPMDPVDTVAWALACETDVTAVIDRVVDLTEIEDIPAPSAPAMELWQHGHASASRRLFRA
ncbi:urease accessory protein UreF [Dermacoccaceae bacterium W4C1]